MPSVLYAETRSIALTLEALELQRAHEIDAKFLPDLPTRVLAAAAAVCQVTPATRLLRPDRHRDICSARRIAAWMLHQRNWSTLRIGRYFGQDHSTVLYGLRRVAQRDQLLLLARRADEQVLSVPRTPVPHQNE